MRSRLAHPERRLVDAVRRGEWLDLGGVADVSSPARKRWRQRPEVRAWVLREILRRKLVPDPDPHGLRLRGAKIVGLIDLENLDTDLQMELENCVIPDGIVVRDAHLPALSLAHCLLGTPIDRSEPSLDGDGLSTGDIRLDGVFAWSNCERGCISLIQADIAGDLVLSDAWIMNVNGPALRGNRLTVRKDVFLEGLNANSAGDVATIALRGARIGGQLRFAHRNMDGSDRRARLANLQTEAALLDMEGAVYSSLPDGITIDGFLELMRNGMGAYSPQPYRQLAEVCRSAGLDGKARKVLVAQRDDQLRKVASDMSPRERAWSRFTGWTLGYGYKPWRAGYGLLGVAVSIHDHSAGVVAGGWV